MIEHQIDLHLASGADLRLLYFSDTEQRWIFSYAYVGKTRPGCACGRPEAPGVLNQVRLTADYASGDLTRVLVLAMHVVIPSRLGQEYYVGVDISPGAKTYLEFRYERAADAAEYRLVEICKGARDRVRLGDQAPSLVRPIAFPFPVPDRSPAIAFPFPVPDRIPAEGARLRVPFRQSCDAIAHFELPTRTAR